MVGNIILYDIVVHESLVVCRSIPPDRLKQITDLLESDIMIRYVYPYSGMLRELCLKQCGCHSIDL